MFRGVVIASLFSKTLACGGFFCAPDQPVVQSGEAIIFGVQGNKVSMHVLINYEGPAEDFSWLLPLMHQPTLSIGSDPYFISMFQETYPTFNLNVNFTGGDEDCRPDMTGPVCSVADSESAGASLDRGGVEIETGSVGPFDYQVIQGEKDQVLTWLADNGYDQYAGSDEIIELYNGFFFLALQLKKEAEAGDIVPVIIEYDVEEGAEEFACIPIVLTSVAVTDSLPILVYVLGESRADPANFFRVELDDAKVNWVNCQGDACFYQDYQDRAKAVFETLDDHAFVVEYAGPSSIMDGKIEFDIDSETLATVEDPLEFLMALSDAGVPSFDVLDQILTDFFGSPINPFQCDSLYNPNNMFLMENCLPDDASSFDAPGLAARLEKEVFEPARAAEAYTRSFSYLTRLYVDMNRENMNRDPFFRFRADGDLPDVSNVHTATATPLCEEMGEGDLQFRGATGLEITLEDNRTFVVEASFACGAWFTSQTLVGDEVSPAQKIIVPAYGSQSEDRVLLRSSDGSFDADELKETGTILEDRSMMPDANISVADANISAPVPSPTSLSTKASTLSLSISLGMSLFMWGLQ